MVDTEHHRPQFIKRILVATALWMSLLSPCAFADEPSPPWSVSKVHVKHTDGLRVLIIHDMEGLSGQDRVQSFLFGTPDYQKGQTLLAGDVNAVVDGLFAGGADEVHVVDGHGSGNADPDLPPDLLDPRATHLFKERPFFPTESLVAPDAYDAIVLVGFHGKTGGGGFAAHTRTFGMDIRFNGRSVNEVELAILAWGEVGIPIIMASGDNVLGKELSTMPWIDYVETKMAKNVEEVQLYPIASVHADLRRQAQRALRRLTDKKIATLLRPATVTLRARPPASFSALRGVPGIPIEQGNSISFIAEGGFTDASRGLNGLIRAARTGWFGAIMGTLSQSKDEQTQNAVTNALVRAWIDQEKDPIEKNQRSDNTQPQRYNGVK